MKRFKQVETRLLLFLISGILLLSIGFVSCGTGPQTKTTVPDRGAYAVDFSAAPSQLGFISLGKSKNSMAGLTGFTVEACVKRNTSGTLNGGIFSRGTGDDDGSDWDGILLHIETNVPVFTMAIATTGSPYEVSGTTALTNGSWTHIAAVFANTDHTSVHGTTATCTSANRSATPHIDIYVDGTLISCATTSSNNPAAFEYNEQIGRSQIHALPSGSGSNLDTKLNAVIDEVRFWKVARTPSQIQQCRTQELGVSGTCMITLDLIGYWRLNQGTGTAITDYSGAPETGIANTGTKNYCDSDCAGAGATTILWEGGWTTGYLF